MLTAWGCIAVLASSVSTAPPPHYIVYSAFPSAHTNLFTIKKPAEQVPGIGHSANSGPRNRANRELRREKEREREAAIRTDEPNQNVNCALAPSNPPPPPPPPFARGFSPSNRNKGQTALKPVRESLPFCLSKAFFFLIFTLLSPN